MAQRLGKYQKTNYMSGSNKAPFQSGNLNFSFPVRAIKERIQMKVMKLSIASHHPQNCKLNLFTK